MTVEVEDEARFLLRPRRVPGVTGMITITIAADREGRKEVEVALTVVEGMGMGLERGMAREGPMAAVVGVEGMLGMVVGDGGEK